MIRRNAIPAEIIQTAKRLPAIRQSVKQAGLPLAAGDIRRKPPIPEAQNAAVLYRQAYRVYHKQGLGKLSDNWADFLKPDRTPAGRRAAQEALNRSSELLRLADLIAARPRCDFDRPWEKGAEAVIMMELAVMRQLTRLLALQAILHIEDNNPLEAVSSLKKAAMVVRHAAEEPVIIGVILWAAFYRIVHEAFVELLQRYGNYAEVVQAAGTLQQRLDYLPELRRVFGGESCIVFSSLELHRQGKQDVTDDLFWEEEELPKRAYFIPGARRIYADAWEVRFLEFFQRLFREIEAPNRSLLRLWKSLESLGASQESRILSRLPQLSYAISANLAPLYASTLLPILQVTTLANLRQAAITVLRGQNATGKLPTALPDAPMDPFTDRPLVYRRTAIGFLLYSLSINGTDEGGDSRPMENSKVPVVPRDIVFRYPQ